MPKLACRSCGRQVYTVAAMDSLFAEERRCPRCGAFMDRERRETDRRGTVRRANPPHDPGAPGGVGERRLVQRRSMRRRSGDGGGWASR